MKKSLERFLPQTEREKIESCVRRAEIRTRGEIMVVVVASSHPYPLGELRAAAAFAFPAAVALTPLLGGLFWVGPHNLWIFLGTLIPLFLVSQAVVKHLPALKRIFISERELEAESSEAAEAQFFQQGVHRTREETGVLIYVSVFERKVRVLADRGINAKIPEGYWTGVVDTTVQAIREGRAADGICAAVSQVAGVLEEKFPVRSDDADELKNVIIEGGPA
jgi:putative membrane protein